MDKWIVYWRRMNESDNRKGFNFASLERAGWDEEIKGRSCYVFRIYIKGKDRQSAKIDKITGRTPKSIK